MLGAIIRTKWHLLEQDRIRIEKYLEYGRLIGVGDLSAERRRRIRRSTRDPRTGGAAGGPEVLLHERVLEMAFLDRSQDVQHVHEHHRG